MSGGTVNVARSLWDDPAFIDAPFSEREAWIWLIAEASWKPRERRIGKVVVMLDRGQVAHSTRFLADAWQWTHSRVRRFLERLENRHMIERQSGTGVSVICIMKYDTYQNTPQASGTAMKPKSAQLRHSSGTNDNKGEIKGINNTPLTPLMGGDRFDDFWQACPRKVAKGNAKKAYDKAIKDTNPQVIIKAMQEFAALQSGKDIQFIPHPASWINARRWEDERPTQLKQDPREGDRRIKDGVEQEYAGYWAGGWQNV
jgi:hypothetical protein